MKKAKKKNKLSELIGSLKDQMRLDPKSYRLYSILRIFVILIAVRSFFTRNYENVALCILSLILFLVPALAERTLKIDIPQLFQAIIYMFIYAAWILGEIGHYYTKFPGWDTMLHTLNGFLCAAVGYSMIYLLNRKSKNISLSPFYMSMVAFCFSMTIGVLWEFVEFTMDQLFYLDMQKDFIVQTISSVTLDPNHSQVPYKISHIVKTIIETSDGTQYTVDGGYLDIGILDTMKDLLVNLAGAVTFCIFGYVYVKHTESGENSGDGSGRILRTSRKLADGFIVKPVDEQKEKELADEVKRLEQERETRKGAGREKLRKGAKTFTEKAGDAGPGLRYGEDSDSGSGRK